MCVKEKEKGGGCSACTTSAPDKEEGSIKKEGRAIVLYNFIQMEKGKEGGITLPR